MDIKARNSKGEIILIEVQNTRELYYLERILYGVAKAITEHISLGDSYREVKKVYSIGILYFDLGVGSDYLYHGQNTFVGVHTLDLLQIRTKEKQAIVSPPSSEIFPEYILIRVNEFDKVAVTPLEEWMRYLKYGTISPKTKAPGLGEALEKLKYYSMSDKERHAYDEHLNAVMIQNDVLNTAKMEGLEEGRAEGHAKGLEEGRAEGRAEGREEGREEGQQEERIKNARNLKKIKENSTLHNIKAAFHRLGSRTLPGRPYCQATTVTFTGNWARGGMRVSLNRWPSPLRPDLPSRSSARATRNPTRPQFHHVRPGHHIVYARKEQTLPAAVTRG